MRVKIKEELEDWDELLPLGFNFDITYQGQNKDNGCIEIRGFEFERHELEFIGK